MGLFDSISKAFNESGLKDGLKQVGDGINKAATDTGIKDGLKQVGEGLDKAASQLGEDFKKSDFKASLDKAGRDRGITSGSKTTSKTVPEEYLSFPQFEGTIKDLSTKKIDKYHRCTIDYSGVTSEALNAYKVKITDAGYVKGSDVRYDKDNTYIIVEYEEQNLHLVFHVKH